MGTTACESTSRSVDPFQVPRFSPISKCDSLGLPDPYYPRVRNGLDALLQSFCFEAVSLSLENSTWEATNPHFLFIDDVIYTDLLDGLQTSSNLTDREARQLAPTDVVGQTLIFVSITLMLGALFFNAYRPFVARVLKEVQVFFSPGWFTHFFGQGSPGNHRSGRASRLC